MPDTAKVTVKSRTPITDSLRTYRNKILATKPDDYDPTEPGALAQELQEWRNLLARLTVVQTNPRHTGWGPLEPRKP